MKQIVTYLSIFGGGALIGVFATKSYFEKKYKDISDAEIESVKEVFKRKTKELVEEDRNSAEEIVDSIISVDTNDKRSPIGGGLFMNLVPEHMKEMQINYNTMSNDILDTEHPTEENYKPYLIDVDTFDETADGYSKVEYSYYMDDSTLVSIEDEIISAADTIGLDNLELFEAMEDEVCYIRNEFTGADYEVTKVFSSYSAVVGDNY